MISGAQKIVILTGLCVLIVSCLYVPWVQTKVYNGRELRQFIGYQWIWLEPVKKRGLYEPLEEVTEARLSRLTKEYSEHSDSVKDLFLSKLKPNELDLDVFEKEAEIQVTLEKEYQREYAHERERTPFTMVDVNLLWFYLVAEIIASAGICLLFSNRSRAGRIQNTQYSQERIHAEVS